MKLLLIRLLNRIFRENNDPDFEWSNKKIGGVLIVWFIGLLAADIFFYGVYQYIIKRNESGLCLIYFGLGLNIVIGIGAVIAGRLLNLRK